MSTIEGTSVRGITIDGHLRVPADIDSLQKFREWVHADDFPEKMRVSYIAGDVEVQMSPENAEFHGKPKVQLIMRLALLIEEREIGDLYTDSMMLVCPEADLATEPDVVFCSYDAQRAGRVRASEWVAGSGNLVEIVGAPDLVVEVVSRSSVRKDTKSLREKYFKAGIPEYWLIDTRGFGIDFQLLVRGAAGFEPVAPDAEGYRLSPVFQTSFSLTRRRNPLGAFSYKLMRR
ncbi:MAG TPA: Uma2 family endonuclease [Pirellulales bacterium]|nr:Uma2 family endonuclease [Pirellulales bacterium]